MNKRKWRPSKSQLYVERFLQDNGFKIVDCKEYSSKNVYTLSRDDRLGKIEVSSNVTDPKTYVTMFLKTWELETKLLNLKEE